MDKKIKNFDDTETEEYKLSTWKPFSNKQYRCAQGYYHTLWMAI